MKAETRHVKYAFADVVGFSVNRTIEAQVEIVAALNQAFLTAAQSQEVIFLPTGDGICASIVGVNASADAHLQLALDVLKLMNQWTEQVAENRKCKIRFGVNEAVDTLITDINDRRNVAGAGINQAQRIMSIADGNQIILGRGAFDSLSVHDDYVGAFRKLRVEVKYGQILPVFQFVRNGFPFLNTDVPIAVQRTDPIELTMAQALGDRENFSTSGQVRCICEATERWEGEMQIVLADLGRDCTPEQAVALRKAQTAWENYRAEEMNWLGALRATVHGTMYRVFGADIDRQLVRKHVKRLRVYRDEWLRVFK
ncbi:MAG TPA: lysozyme inhibitor LprI family protein [Candidatus Udaeobacter sp.]|jgi:class 3 adenylate cyclase